MRALMLLAATTLLATPALAQPPEGALPLSEILAIVEAREGVTYLEEIEWDDDGYWDMEFHTANGSTEVRIDPRTGERHDDLRGRRRGQPLARTTCNSGMRSPMSGPCDWPVSALRSGMNRPLPLRPVASFTFAVHWPQVSSV